MTDLEKHVNQPGRAKLVKNVREKINELGITYIYYQFIHVCMCYHRMSIHIDSIVEACRRKTGQKTLSVRKYK